VGARLRYLVDMVARDAHHGLANAILRVSGDQKGDRGIIRGSPKRPSDDHTNTALMISSPALPFTIRSLASSSTPVAIGLERDDQLAIEGRDAPQLSGDAEIVGGECLVSTKADRRHRRSLRAMRGRSNGDGKSGRAERFAPALA
jgi:hypothetical protein